MANGGTFEDLQCRTPLIDLEQKDDMEYTKPGEWKSEELSKGRIDYKVSLTLSMEKVCETLLCGCACFTVVL